MGPQFTNLVGVFELIFKLVRASRIGILLRSDLNLA